MTVTEPYPVQSVHPPGYYHSSWRSSKTDQRYTERREPDQQDAYKSYYESERTCQEEEYEPPSKLTVARPSLVVRLVPLSILVGSVFCDPSGDNKNLVVVCWHIEPLDRLHGSPLYRRSSLYACTSDETSSPSGWVGVNNLRWLASLIHSVMLYGHRSLVTANDDGVISSLSSNRLTRTLMSSDRKSVV